MDGRGRTGQIIPFRLLWLLEHLPNFLHLKGTAPKWKLPNFVAEHTVMFLLYHGQDPNVSDCNSLIADSTFCAEDDYVSPASKQPKKTGTILKLQNNQKSNNAHIFWLSVCLLTNIFSALQFRRKAKSVENNNGPLWKLGIRECLISKINFLRHY